MADTFKKVKFAMKALDNLNTVTEFRFDFLISIFNYFRQRNSVFMLDVAVIVKEGECKEISLKDKLIANYQKLLRVQFSLILIHPSYAVGVISTARIANEANENLFRYLDHIPSFFMHRTGCM